MSDETPVDRLLESVDLRDDWEISEQKDDHLTLDYTAVPRNRLERTALPGLDIDHLGNVWAILSHDRISEGFDIEHAGVRKLGISIDCTNFDDAVKAVEHAMECVEESVGEELRKAHDGVVYHV